MQVLTKQSVHQANSLAMNAFTRLYGPITLVMVNVYVDCYDHTTS